jgi:hypothetical protein
MSWTNNQAIRFRVGTIALWNLLTKRIINLRDPSMGVLQTHFERCEGIHQVVNEFTDMTTRELPATLQERRAKQEMYAAQTRDPHTLEAFLASARRIEA